MSVLSQRNVTAQEKGGGPLPVRTGRESYLWCAVGLVWPSGGRHGDVYPVVRVQGLVMVLKFNVTLPERARARPTIVAFGPLFSVMLVFARMVPLNSEFENREAEEPTCQKTSEATAPPVRSTLATVLTVSADPIWKM